MSESAENAPVQEPVSKQRRKRTIFVYGVVSLLNVGLLALIVTQLLTPAQHGGSDTLIGHRAPNFSLAMLRSSSGKHMLSLADFAGKPILLNFWASWCGPCKEEAPLLESTWKQVQVQGKDAVFLGIEFQGSSNDGISFLQSYNITYPAVLDASGSVASSYGVTSLPVTIFINREGVVMGREARELSTQSLASKLRLIV